MSVVFDERYLLLLGLLVSQDQHGYQINEFIEKNLSRITTMKKSTAYSLLDRLSDHGYVSVEKEQDGNRPVRKVFSMTEKGRHTFFELLRTNLLEGPQMTFSHEIGLMFLDHLPVNETIECLTERLNKLKQEAGQLEKAPKHGFGIGVDLAMQHHLHMVQADIEWLTQTIKQLSSV